MQHTRENSTNSKQYLSVVDLVSARTGVTRANLVSHIRGQDEIAHARQLAMYLMHVTLGATLTRVGRVFGRDRTTVAHACARVEDRRDDEQFDLFVDGLEHEIQTQAKRERTPSHSRNARLQSEAA